MRLNSFQWTSLKTRIPLFSLLLILISIGSLAIYASHTLRKDMQRLLGEQQLSTVSLVANEVNQKLTSHLQILQIVAKEIHPELMKNPARLQAVLKEFPIFQDGFSGGTFVTEVDGATIDVTQHGKHHPTGDPVNAEHVAAALRQGQPAIGRPVLDKALQEPVLGMATPIRNAQGQVIGALSGVIHMTKSGIFDGISRSHYGKSGGYVLVAPQHRMIVAASDTRRSLEILPARGTSPTLDRFIDGYEGTDIFVNPVGVEVLASVKRVPVSGWYVAVTLPTTEAFAPIHDLQQRMLMAAAWLALLAGGLTWWLLRRQMAPLEATAHTLAALSDQHEALRPLPVKRDDEVGQVISGFNQLLTELSHQQTGLKDSEERYRSVFQTIPDAVTITRLSDGRYLEINTGFLHLFEWARDEVLGRTSQDLNIWHHREDRELLMRAIQDDGYCESLEVDFRTKNGRKITALVSARAITLDSEQCLLAVTRDITERKAAQEEIYNLAFTDALTGLSNRRLLLDRLNQALISSVHQQRHGALLLVDLDGFKSLNETLGHDKGDALLLEVKSHLLNCVHEGDTVARIGGDEFVILLESMASSAREAASQAEVTGKKILLALNKTYPFGESFHNSSASIGVTLFGDKNEDANEPLKRAELAMYQAKSAGRNTLRFYEPKMQAAVSERVSLEASLREALLKAQFELHYQAQVSDQHKITGVEALLRWQDPRRGMVSPAEFIPLAEESGLIIPVGHWVIETACRQLAQWAHRRETEHLVLSVNVSARQFHQSDFVEQVLAAIASNGVKANRLKLELTESLLVVDIEGVIAKMNALKANGMGFSLDDFGTGYSSLSYLKRLPLDQLKIDQGFVRDILLDPDDAAIAKMVIALANSLSLQVVAEGVETQAQQKFLAGLGCHSYQGYLFNRPMPVEEFEKFLARW
jgi:diguanylate cyclase (GGDEF)-like protein/PAS domain S-box-containing protein